MTQLLSQEMQRASCNDLTTLHKRFAVFVAAASVPDAADADLFPGEVQEVKTLAGAGGGREERREGRMFDLLFPSHWWHTFTDQPTN